MRNIVICIVVLAFGMFAQNSIGADEMSGLDIAKLADENNSGFGDLKVNLEMVLKSPQGREARREISVSVLEVPEDGDKSLIVFQSPPDQRGTALLSHAHKVEDDDQYLFLPALRRVKRIASNNRSGSFVGSEFAFEDLIVEEIGKYDYEYIGEEPCADTECYVVDRFPLSEESGYIRQRVWYDKDHYRIFRVEFYNRSHSLLKVLEFRDYKQYGSFWRASFMEMTNQQTLASTQLHFSEYLFGTGLNDEDFSMNALRRVR